MQGNVLQKASEWILFFNLTAVNLAQALAPVQFKGY